MKAYGSKVDYGPTGITNLKLMVRSILFFSQSMYLGVSDMTVSMRWNINKTLHLHLIYDASYHSCIAEH